MATDIASNNGGKLTLTGASAMAIIEPKSYRAAVVLVKIGQWSRGHSSGTNNTYSGGTTVTGGTLQLGDASALGT